MAKNLLIVESPSKAKTLKKYLGGDFEILASYGHVRDLIPKNGAVDPEHDFAMKYELIKRNAKHVDAIVAGAKEAENIYLATDPDREGEAISWHLFEILKSKRGLKNIKPQRVVFHEITKNAVLDAVAHPREIEMDLVDAQQARRALDYLVGFNLSPLLWKKIRRGLSAGRVQSPALRLICERENEIRAFEAQEYWTVHLDSHKGRSKFTAKLAQYNGAKLEQFDLPNEAAQADVLKELEGKGRVVLRASGTEPVVRVMVEANGKPSSVEIVSASHPLFGRSAADTVRQSYTFVPAKRNGQPVRQSYTFTLRFKAP